MDKDFIKSLAASQQAEQQAEQQMAAFVQLAAMIRVYYQELREQGFSKAEALTLSGQVQTAILNAKPRD